MMRLDAAELSSFLSSSRTVRAIGDTDTIRLSSRENEVELRATDLEHTTVRRLLSPKPEGEFFLSRKQLVGAITGAKAGSEVTISKADTSRALVAVNTVVGPKRTRIGLLAADDFSSEPTGALTPIPIAMSAVHRLLAAGGAVERNDTRAEYCGIVLKPRGGYLVAEGTNGKRVVRVSSSVVVSEDFGGQVIPHKSVALINALDVDDGEIIGLSVGERQWCIQHEHGRIFGPIVEAKPLDFDRVIPTEFGTTVVLSRDEAKAVLAAVGPSLASQRHRQLFVGVRGCEVTFATTGDAPARLDIEAETSGTEGWAWLNADDLKAVLEGIESPALRISFTTNGPMARMDAPDDEPSDLFAAAVLFRERVWEEWTPTQQAAE